jgi:hypothetical protein
VTEVVAAPSPTPLPTLEAEPPEGAGGSYGAIALSADAPLPEQLLPAEEAVAESPAFEALPPSLAEAEAADRAAAGAGRRSRAWLWVLGGIVLLGGAGAAAFFSREPSTGRVVLDVSPPEARGRVRLTVGGTDLGMPTHWPVVQAVPSGKVEILASADGFKPALVDATVGRGDAATPVLVALQRAATVARFTVLPEPDDAEVRLDGQVVKRAGTRGLYVGELAPGSEHSLQVRRAGYKPLETRVSAKNADEPVELRTMLEPLEYPLQISSVPPGAVVFSGERLLGVTPLATRVPATATALTFRKRCFETAQVPLHLPEQPAARVPVKAALRKVPGCR